MSSTISQSSGERGSREQREARGGLTREREQEREEEEGEEEEGRRRGESWREEEEEERPAQPTTRGGWGERGGQTKERRGRGGETRGEPGGDAGKTGAKRRVGSDEHLLLHGKNKKNETKTIDYFIGDMGSVETLADSRTASTREVRREDQSTRSTSDREMGVCT